MKITWTKKTAQYTNGEDGKVGRWTSFSINWDAALGSKDPNGPWKLTCMLPGIKPVVGNFKTTDEAKARADFIVEYWFEEAGK